MNKGMLAEVVSQRSLAPRKVLVVVVVVVVLRWF